MMNSRRIVAAMLARRHLSDQPPKKFKNFAEISQASNQKSKPSNAQAKSPANQSPPKPVETQSAKAQQPPAPPKAAPRAPERPSPVTASAGANQAAGSEYLVPEYSKHNEYSFYDLNTDMLKGRIPQPKAERRD